MFQNSTLGTQTETSDTESIYTDYTVRLEDDIVSLHTKGDAPVRSPNEKVYTPRSIATFNGSPSEFNNLEYPQVSLYLLH